MIWYNRLWKRATWLVFVFTAALIVSFVYAKTPILLAQESTTQDSATPLANPNPVSADQVNDVARTLWCPLCSGVRLDSCELKACEQMRDVIALKLGQGEDAESIRAYFFEQYGPQVMGEPPLEGFSWLAWILPVVVVVGGGWLTWSRMKRMVHPGAVTGNEGTSISPTEQANDEYAQKLQKELENYG